MKVSLKCFSTLVDPNTCDFKNATVYELVTGQTVGDLARYAGIDREDIKIAFVNSRKANLETHLSDNDQVGLSPAVGGM